MGLDQEIVLKIFENEQEPEFEKIYTHRNNKYMDKALMKCLEEEPYEDNCTIMYLDKDMFKKVLGMILQDKITMNEFEYYYKDYPEVLEKHKKETLELFYNISWITLNKNKLDYDITYWKWY